MIRRPLLATCIALALPMGACARTAPTDDAVAAVAAPAAVATDDAAQGDAGAALPSVLVHKNASCGCCHLWVEHMRKAGFTVEVRDVGDMGPVKERVGIPAGMGSCHTAEVAGYFIEGHVPAEDVKRLLAERPDARGLTVPGMPLGSPGMEMPNGRTQPYDVVLVTDDGHEVFAHHGG